jgi:hypothetical protein
VSAASVAISTELLCGQSGGTNGSDRAESFTHFTNALPLAGGRSRSVARLFADVSATSVASAVPTGSAAIANASAHHVVKFRPPTYRGVRAAPMR